MAKIRDPLPFAEHFGIGPLKLERIGILNPVLNVDTKLFIDPVLLETSSHSQLSTDATSTFRKYFEDIISTDSRSIEGIYRNGKIELLETPTDVDESRVIVTFVSESAIDLPKRGIGETQAAGLRVRLQTFADDWDRPEMGAYDAL